MQTALVAAACMGLAGFSARAQVPPFQNGVEVGRVTVSFIREASGLASSRINPGVLWTHNDSGDSARIFAINRGGALLATYNLTGIKAKDWEDMAICRDPSNGVDCIYIADIGDNGASRSSVAVYRVPEPAVDTNQFDLVASMTGTTTYAFKYSDGKRNAETLMVDPWTGELTVVSKTKPSGEARLYRGIWPKKPGKTGKLTFMKKIKVGEVVGGDISPSGTGILIKNYTSAYYFARSPGQTVYTAMTSTPVVVPYIRERKGEAIAWSGQEDGYYTFSEGTNQPIYFYAIGGGNADGLWRTVSDGQGAGTGVFAIASVNVHPGFQINAWIGGGMITIEWYASPGYVYEVSRSSESLADASAFKAVRTDITVFEGGMTTVSLPLEGETVCYRVVARPASGH